MPQQPRRLGSHIPAPFGKVAVMLRENRPSRMPAVSLFYNLASYTSVERNIPPSPSRYANLCERRHNSELKNVQICLIQNGVPHASAAAEFRPFQCNERASC